jgi:hypothetical protein
MLVFNKYFYKNKKLKLYFGDRVAVLNDFIYQTGWSTTYGVDWLAPKILAHQCFGMSKFWSLIGLLSKFCQPFTFSYY